MEECKVYFKLLRGVERRVVQGEDGRRRREVEGERERIREILRRVKERQWGWMEYGGRHGSMEAKK